MKSPKLAVTRVAMTWLVSVCLANSPTLAQTHPDQVLVDGFNPVFQDFFGYQVHIEGDRAFATVLTDAGQPGFSNGSVHVFERTPQGWDFLQKITPSRMTGPDFWYLGQALRTIDDFLFIGAYGADVPDNARGLVEVYRLLGGRYEYFQTLTGIPGQTTLAALGVSLAIRDGEIFVSMSGTMINGLRRGAIARFRFDGQRWQHIENIYSPDPTILYLGSEIRFDGDRLIAASNGLLAVVFEEGPAGWAQIQTFVRSGTNSTMDFWANDGWVLCGDSRRHSGSPGYVQVYHWNGALYDYVEALSASDFPSGIGHGAAFGQRLHGLGNRVVIGAPDASRDGIHAEGAAYIFELENGSWVEKERLDPPLNNDPGFHAGFDIHVQDDTIIVGATLHSVNGVLAGAAYIYERPFGDEVCTGEPNSTGSSADLEIFGNRAARAGAIRLEGSGLPANAFALFFAGRAAGSVAMPGGSQGTLCISGSIGRFGAAQATAQGDVTFLLDTSSIPPQIGGGIQPGDTFLFQAWYRDANPMAASNFTAARSVEFR